MTSNHSTTEASVVPSPPTALENFVLTSCHPIRYVASDQSISLLGTLKTPYPGEMDCGKNGTGMTASVGASPLESSHEFEQLQASISSHNETGWSLSTWFTPYDTSSTRTESIVTFGASASTVSSVDENERGPEAACSGNYFQIAQFRSSVLVRFQDSEDATSCRKLLLKQVSLVPHTLTQVTVTVGPTSSGIYVNGKGALENIPFGPRLSLWSHQTRLQLFSAHSSADTYVFQGSIEQVSVFDEELTPEQVADDFRRGVLEAPPLAPFTLGAASNDPIVIAQDRHERKRFFVGGNRESSEFLPLAVQILKLPSQGQVFRMDSPVPLTPANNSIIMKLNPEDYGFWLEYEHTPSNIFSVPRTDALGGQLELSPDFLQFRLVALNSTQNIVGQSDVVAQEFEIQHVNHKPTWIAQENATVAIVDGLPEVDIGSIRLDDSSDMDMNRVRIDLVVANGTLTLNPLYSGLADFTNCTSLRSSNWYCRGNGVDDAFMTFLAVPSHVQLILSGLRYRGYLPGSADTIMLSVFDGAGGPCLSLSDHEEYQRASGLPTIHRECFLVKAEVSIPAIELPNSFDEDEKGFLRLPNSDFTDFGLADALFWIVLISILVCCFCCLRQCASCLARGTAIVPDDYDSDDGRISYQSDTDSESDISSIGSIPEEQPDVESCTAEESATESMGDGESPLGMCENPI